MRERRAIRKAQQRWSAGATAVQGTPAMVATTQPLMKRWLGCTQPARVSKAMQRTPELPQAAMRSPARGNSAREGLRLQASVPRGQLDRRFWPLAAMDAHAQTHPNEGAREHCVECPTGAPLTTFEDR